MIVKWHYAPMAGYLLRRLDDGGLQGSSSWPEHHEWMEEFQKQRASGEVVLLQTINYGHELFHGHSGRVDVYGCANAGT